MPVAGGWSQTICQGHSDAGYTEGVVGDRSTVSAVENVAESLRQAVSFFSQLLVSLDELRW